MRVEVGMEREVVIWLGLVRLQSDGECGWSMVPVGSVDSLFCVLIYCSQDRGLASVHSSMRHP
jgi:hypothetical protein